MNTTQVATMTEKTTIDARERLIVALDTETPQHARELVRELGEQVSFYKIGWRLFLQAGLDLVAEVQGQGKRVFLDLKMEDIAETIETAVRVLAGRAQMLTIMGGRPTVEAAVRGRGAFEDPRILSVTFLSSQNEQDLSEALQLSGAQVEEGNLERYILHRASLALAGGADGFIASGSSIASIRRQFGPAPLIVTPGIRPAGEGDDDHKRSATPSQAIRNGSDYLVVGRPIWRAQRPLEAAMAIAREMQGTFDELG